MGGRRWFPSIDELFPPSYKGRPYSINFSQMPAKPNYSALAQARANRAMEALRAQRQAITKNRASRHAGNLAALNEEQRKINRERTPIQRILVEHTNRIVHGK